MTEYRVRFVKRLCDDTGHQHDCVEGEVRVRRARDQARAMQAAKLRFQRAKHAPNWQTYADRVEVVR